MSVPKIFASFDPSDMKQGGSLFDNVDLEIVAGTRYSMEAPDNYHAEGHPIFAWVEYFMYSLPDERKDKNEPDPRRVNQSYSLGAKSGENFTISEDGNYLIPVEGNVDSDGKIIEPLRLDSKFGTYVDALKKEGVPATILRGGNISGLVGLKGRFVRKADKERNFGDSKPAGDGKKNPPSTLVLAKAPYQLPGGQAATPTTAAAKPAATTTAPATSAPAAEVSGDLDSKTGIYLAKVVKSKNGKVQRSQLTLLVAQAAMKDPQRQEIAKRAQDEAFLLPMNEAGGVLDENGEIVALKYDPTAKPQVVTLG